MMKMNDKPVVSVVLATYNRAGLLSRAIDSVIAQTYKDFELIIVSDGSTDNTDEVVNSYNDPRILFLENDKKEGLSSARNSGFHHSSGKYIALLDDDDEWHPEKLEIQVPFIDKTPDSVGIVYTWMEYIVNGKRTKIFSPRVKGNFLVQMLDKQAIGGDPTLLIKRKVFDVIGGYDEAIKRGVGGDFNRRAARYFEVDFIPKILVRVYAEHDFIRITENDRESHMNAIEGQKIKLQKFKKEFKEYPAKAARVHAIIGFHYSEINEGKKAIEYFKKAVTINRFDNVVFKKIFLSIAKKIKKYLLNKWRILKCQIF